VAIGHAIIAKGQVAIELSTVDHRSFNRLNAYDSASKSLQKINEECMGGLNRRDVLRGAAALSMVPLLANSESQDAGARAMSRARKSFIHCTDLFRPHDDPDDHWDLATGFALARQGDLDLIGVLTDNPENVEEVPELIDSWNKNNGGVHVARSPDVSAVAQLNYIADKGVPVSTGPIWPGRPGEKIRADNLPKDLRGVNVLLDTLRRSTHPVSILTAGSCQDVAIAGMKEPNLFAEKCSGIYLNAGAGSQNHDEQSVDGNVEWNVGLNRGAYATTFELPCPIYWMPCFYGFSKTDVIAGEYGTVWSFRQKEILPYLSDRLQVFFAYVLSKESGTNWLTYLLDQNSKKVVQNYLDDERGMYSTAGFFHAAGKEITVDGLIVPLGQAKESAAYDFVPIEVHCDANGITDWHKAVKPSTRCIFRVRDRKNYTTAMIKALKTTLQALS
jgi:hypothetical protein